MATVMTLGWTRPEFCFESSEASALCRIKEMEKMSNTEQQVAVNS